MVRAVQSNRGRGPGTMHPVHHPGQGLLHPGQGEDRTVQPLEQDADKEPSNPKKEASDQDQVKEPPNPENSNAQRLLAQDALDDASLKELVEPLFPETNLDSISRVELLKQVDQKLSSNEIKQKEFLASLKELVGPLLPETNLDSISRDELLKQVDQKLSSGEITQEEFLSAVQNRRRNEAKQKEEKTNKDNTGTAQAESDQDEDNTGTAQKKSDQDKDEFMFKPIDPQANARALTYANTWFSKKDVKSLDHRQLSVLAAPFFSSETDLYGVHKSVLEIQVEKNLLTGEITQERFWSVAPELKNKGKRSRETNDTEENPKVQARKAPKVKPRTTPPDSNLHAPQPSPWTGPPAPIPPPAYGYTYPPQAGAAYPGTHHPHPSNGPTMPPNPQPSQKYRLYTPPSIWNMSGMGYPAGTLLGGPLPPSPSQHHAPSICGIFHSSGLLPLGPSCELIGRGDAGAQMMVVLGKLDQILDAVAATVADIVTMTIYAVDLDQHSKQIMEEKELFFDYMKKRHGNILTSPEKNYAFSIVGVESLMPVGALVQMDVRVIVRRALLSNFEVQNL